MSYILDALRRAEAERERGAVPGVHTEQFPMMSADDEARRRPVWLIASVAGLALALAAVIGWIWLGGGAARQPVVVAAAPLPLPVTPPAPPSPAATATSPPPTAPSTPPAPTAPSPAPIAAPGMPAAAPPATATPPATPTAARAAARPRPPPPAAPTPGTTAPGVPPPQADRVYAVADLPEPVKRSMPQLAFGGSSYSTSATSRMVIWNGRVFHEGDSVAKDVQLRQINRKSAVLAVRGYRVEVPF